ncbi:MAG: regulatory protein RecX [Pseudoxanthomonas suwonensis]|nr:regulatory protein RecX [Pseudoxanthomonas suwonensis]
MAGTSPAAGADGDAPVHPGIDSASGDARRGKPRRKRRPEATPEQRALGLLVRREHSRKELARKLVQRGVEPDQAETAVGRMQAEGWQDDARFAEALVRSRGFGGHGPIRIRAELAMHGLEPEVVAAALEAFEGDWTAIARGLVRRRHGQFARDDRVTQRKAAALLVRRGYSADQIRAATRFDPDDEGW